ncbi:MAG: HPr family phosphocarrier protein [Bdellovibrionota bacterium]
MNEHAATISVVNKLGLHARPAGQLVKLAQSFPKTELRIAKDGEEINGKSIMGVLTLAAARGEQLQVRAWGDGAKELVEKIQALFENRFGEPE